MLFLARGIEDDHYWVVQEVDGVLVETPWRIEHEADGYRLSHADDATWTAVVFALGAFSSPESAIDGLRALL
jgi:hypothetical protein